MIAPGGDTEGVTVLPTAGHVGQIRLSAPPNNLLTVAMVTGLADAIDALAETDCRAIVLRAEGKHFCAGMNLAKERPGQAVGAETLNPLYVQARRLISSPLPVIAVIQGAAIGGGLGLALVADFRIAGPRALFAANFARLGIHHGFGLSSTLPPVVGQQRALELLSTGRRIGAEQAAAWGLCDRLVAEDRLGDEADEFAAELASAAPLAVRSIRTTLRAAVLAGFEAATWREHQEQHRLGFTDDAREGVDAMREKRDPVFTGR